MTDLLDRAIAEDIPLPHISRAPRTVTCPKCRARPGEHCTSTGGGNYAHVVTHKARTARIAHWSADLLARAAAAYDAQGRRPWWDMPAGHYTEFEHAAAPLPDAKRWTPKGVPLSEPQAEAVERTAANHGRYTAPTSHFHGDHQERQSINALEAKGILRHVEYTRDGYGRVLALTDFGWQVYAQHRLVSRRDGITVPTTNNAAKEQQ